MSVSSAGRYAIDTTNKRQARAVVAARVIATDAPAYASPSASAPKKYNPPVTPSSVGNRLTGRSAVAYSRTMRPVPPVRGRDRQHCEPAAPVVLAVDPGERQKERQLPQEQDPEQRRHSRSQGRDRR